MPTRWFRRAFCLLALATAPAVAHALEQVTLQLKWTHAFQFAGYYAAREKGFYREAGLEVAIREAQPGSDPVRQVVAGEAEFGIGSSSLLLARQKGQPVVALAVIFQHSPLVLVARQREASQTVHDLIDQRIMLEPQSEELIAYLRREGIAPGRLSVLAHSFDPQDLIDGRVAAMSAYSTNETWHLERAGVPYLIHSPRAAGIDFYGDNLFTREQLLAERPELVRAFREASLRGWQYAMAHPEEVVELIISHYEPQLPREFLLSEARKMVPLLRPELIEIGYMNPGRWRHIADTYADLGLLPRDFPLEGFLYQEPTADAAPDLIWLYLAGALLALISAVALYTHRINRNLDRALAASRQAEAQIRHLASHDPLTGLPNRALLADRLRQALALAERNQQRLALMFIDLDRFKPVNDSYGHAVGDLLLQEVAQRLLACVRKSDTVARLGGDEFVVLLQAVDDAPSSLRSAEKIHAALRRPFEIAGQSLQISSSIGIALYPQHGGNEIELTRSADQAMYQAKNAGRDRVQLCTEPDVPS